MPRMYRELKFNNNNDKSQMQKAAKDVTKDISPKTHEW